RDFLLRDCRYHHSDVPSCSLRHLRSGSPWPMASILITSAPNSASMRAANGAAIRVPISITLIALKGAVIAGYLLFLEYVAKARGTMIGESSRLSAKGVREMRMLRCDSVVNSGPPSRAGSLPQGSVVVSDS